MASIYDDPHAEAEVPEAIARVEARLDRDDPRRAAALALAAPSPPGADRRARLAKAVQVGFEAADSEYTRLRSFRNAILGSAVILGLALLAFIAYSWNNPTVVPICFTPAGESTCASVGRLRPAKTSRRWRPSGHLVDCSLRLLHQEHAGNIGRLRRAHRAGRAQVPVGALAAIGGLLIVRAQFIPGLSDLDSQAQILAYAFVFGVGQQLVVGLITSRPTSCCPRLRKSATAARPERETVPHPAGSRRSASDEQTVPGGTDPDAAAPRGVTDGDVPAADKDGDTRAEARRMPWGGLSHGGRPPPNGRSGPQESSGRPHPAARC